MTLKSTKPRPDLARAERRIAELAGAYPETTLDKPWGHSAFKVRGKTFLFLGADASAVSLSVKLPDSSTIALALPFTEPTHYGLGKSGWVTATFTSAADIPFDMIKDWLDESYRAVAPKKLANALGTSSREAPVARARANGRPTASKAKPTAKIVARARSKAKIKPTARAKAETRPKR
jgi:predicted DNA-binding protein (MmcQ/YjbR family)